MIPNALNVTIGEDVEVQTAAEAPTRTFKIDFDAGRVGGFCDETEAMNRPFTRYCKQNASNT